MVFIRIVREFAVYQQNRARGWTLCVKKNKKTCVNCENSQSFDYLRSVVVLVRVQGVQNGDPIFNLRAFLGAPIFSICAFKNFWAFVYDCIFIEMITCCLVENLWSLVCYIIVQLLMYFNTFGYMGVTRLEAPGELWFPSPFVMALFGYKT